MTAFSDQMLPPNRCKLEFDMIGRVENEAEFRARVDAGWNVQGCVVRELCASDPFIVRFP